VQGRITFAGNPWPDGHRLDAATWTAWFDPAGRLWFGVELRSEDYVATPPAREGPGDWGSSFVWSNYAACTIDTGRGVLAAEPGRPFRLTAPQTLTADPVAGFDHDAEPAFTVYLLGHDALAGHELVFTPRPGGHDLLWTGSVALVYAGDPEFRHRFRVEVSGLALPELVLPAGTDPATARRWLAGAVDAPERFAPAADGTRFRPV
jgi:hypothetical protein